MSLGKELAGPPTDGITALQFYAHSSLLLASSWDGVSEKVADRGEGRAQLPDSAAPPPPAATAPQTLRVYDAAANTLQGTFAHGAPVLDATFESDGVVYSAGLDGTIKRWVALLQPGPCWLVGAPSAACLRSWGHHLSLLLHRHAVWLCPVQLQLLCRARDPARAACRGRAVYRVAALPGTSGQRGVGPDAASVGPPGPQRGLRGHAATARQGLHHERHRHAAGGGHVWPAGGCMCTRCSR